MAEGEGFEPSRRYDRLRDFQSRALGQAMRPFQLSDPRQRAERVGFEPTVAHHHTAFRERHLQPLGHLSSARVYQVPQVVHHARPHAPGNRVSARQMDTKTARMFPGGLAGTPGRIRTCGLWVRNPTLYPLSYRRAAHIVPAAGVSRQAAAVRREGRDSNPRRTFKALNRLAGGPIRPLWHLPSA